MITPLLGLILMLQGTSVPPSATVPSPQRLKEAVQHFPQSQLEPKVSGPISIDLKGSSRAAYAALAELAGLNIVFDPDFRDSSIAPVHTGDADIFEAFDRLSSMTKGFVEVLGSKTILVSADNATKRSDYEIQVIKTIYPTYAKSPQDLSALAAKLRTTLNMRYLAVSTDSNAIIMRETPDRIAAAEKLIGEVDRPTSSQPIAFDRLGNLFLPEGTGARESSPARSRLQIGSTPPTSIDMNGDSRTTYESLAAMAGLNIIFDADFRSIAVPLKLENVDLLDALDYFAIETRTFWEPVDGTTIMIAPDNQTKRRDYSNLLFRSIYFDNGTPKQITEIITALRTLLNVRYLANVSSESAIGMMETPSRIALAQKIIADITKGKPAQTAASRDKTLEAGNETGGVLRTRAVRNAAPAGSQPALKAAGKISIDINETAHDAFERLAGLAGLQVVFDDRFVDSPVRQFSVKGIGIPDALDFLSLQTRNFWEVRDASTILVAPDNQSVRRDLQPETEDVIALSNSPSKTTIVELVTLLRTLLNIRQIDGSEKGIALRETADNVALAQKIVASLEH